MVIFHVERVVFLSPQTMPFAGTILGGLVPGEMVLIQGAVLREADRWRSFAVEWRTTRSA